MRHSVHHGTAADCTGTVFQRVVRVEWRALSGDSPFAYDLLGEAPGLARKVLWNETCARIDC